MEQQFDYPPAINAQRVGTYPGRAYAGGGYVWDEVLEYRVWCSPRKGAEDHFDGDDYFYPFESYAEAAQFSESQAGAGEPIALILQREFLDEPEPGVFIHRREERITEWPVKFLSRPRRTERTLIDFFAADAPPNRLEILRGLA